MIHKFKRWIDLSHEQAATVPACNSSATRESLEQKEQINKIKAAGSSDASNNGDKAVAVSGCNREQTVGKLEPNEEVHHKEPCSNDVTEDGQTTGSCVKRPNNASDQSAEGKPSDAETQVACQGAGASDKNVPDYPLFPLSRGFCLSLTRALDSFRTALEKAHLNDSVE